ncbi:MAG: histidinol-phosphate transaminase, partial [Bacteroidota bacterium]
MSNPTTQDIQIFKPYLSVTSSYRGGKSRGEAGATQRKTYKLSSNENLLGPSPKAVAALQQHLPHLNEYSDYQDQRLRDALARFYTTQGLDAAQFITANSGVEILEMVVRGFLDTDLEIIISTPAFGPYKLFSLKHAARVVDIPLDATDYSLDVDGILAAVNEKTRLVFLTSPNNPTGGHIPRAELDRLVYSLPNHVVVVYDEVYYQYPTAEDYVRAYEYVQQGRRVIGVNSFSKAYGLAGLRVGYAYSTPEIANYLRQIARPFMINTLTTEAAIAALGDEAHIQRTQELIWKERPRIMQALRHLGVKYWESQANFVLIAPDMDEYEFEQRMLQEGIMVRTMAAFGAPGHIRITIGTEEANDALITALER